MMRTILAGALLLGTIFGAGARAQAPATQPQGNFRTFELTAVLPPTPAMKYQLIIDPLDRHTGNAAIQYLETALLITREHTELLGRIDPEGNNFIADARGLPGPDSTLFDTLKLACECDSCDWQVPLRERGVSAILSHLNGMRQIANVLRYVALAQARDGHPEEALATLSLGYQMAVHVNAEPVMIGGLVSLGISRAADQSLVEVMSAPTCPNLYWALVSRPHAKQGLRCAMEGERCFLFGSIHALDRARRGKTMSAADWKTMFADLERLHHDLKESPDRSIEVEEKATKEIFPEAAEFYIRNKNLSAEQVSALDPAVVNGTFFYDQYQQAIDDLYKILELPYPQMQQQAQKLFKQQAAVRDTPNENPLLRLLPNFGRAIESYIRADEQLAALTVVEAIRAYAAAHDHKLPGALADITDTPVPLNPRTGNEFEYRVEGDKAILSDPEPADYPLEFTIKIR